MYRPTKRFAAMLVAGVAGMAPALAGCGGEPAKTAATGSGSTATADASLPKTVDFNNRDDLAKALASIGVESSTYEVERDRASGPEGIAFPTWPAGEVRKNGLQTYRVDVSPSFEGKATLRFSLGKKPLYEAPFEPTTTTTEAAMPAAVAEGVKKGDVVTWGVYFADKKQKPATVTFTVIEKPSATKKVAELDGNKSLSHLAREVAKAQTLHNYSLLSEALVTYATVGKEDARITSVYAPMMDCLRRLKLKNTPLFEEAKLRAVSDTSPMRGDFRNAGDDLTKAGPVIEAPKPVATAPKGASGNPKLGPGGAGLKPTPTPEAGMAADEAGTASPITDPFATARATAAALANLARESRNRADMLSRDAQHARTEADAAKTEADKLGKQVGDMVAKIKELQDKAADTTNGLSDVERAALMQQANDLSQQLGGLQEKAKAAADHAAELGQKADGLEQRANVADREADQQEEAAKNAGAAALGLPMSPPNPANPANPALGGTGKDFGQYLNSLKSLVTAAQQNMVAASERVNAANVGLETARAAYEAAKAAESATPGTYTPEQLAALDAAVKTAEQEVGASQQALGAAGEALDTAQKNLDYASNQNK